MSLASPKSDILGSRSASSKMHFELMFLCRTRGLQLWCSHASPLAAPIPIFSREGQSRRFTSSETVCNLSWRVPFAMYL
ncbi:hypothetical protein Hanom_Chr08g00750471 [Helianthus anomalus]